MNSRKKLFRLRPYDIQAGAAYFLPAVKELLHFQQSSSCAYAAILHREQFQVDSLKTEEDLFRIPVLPTLYFKKNSLFTMPEEALRLHATSSGTKGAQSHVAFDKESYQYGLFMMCRFFAHHKVPSLLPANYIVLGYEPGDGLQMGAAQTAYGVTRFAPALSRSYALRHNPATQSYTQNLQGVQADLLRYAKKPFPIRLVGFPSYLHFLLDALERQHIRLQLHPQSKVLLGGGWKAFAAQQIDRDAFLARLYTTLSIPPSRCLEFFSAVEHPLPYYKCENGHFHAPVYSRVIIRDVKTLLPVSDGTPGLLSFVSPLVMSMPLTSIVTDDIALAGTNCQCNVPTPYFKLLGRAGLAGIKTCTADAAALLQGGQL